MDPDRRIVVLVPRRPDSGDRDRVWAWLRAKWQAEHPGWDVFEGDEGGAGEFNRSAAINDAADQAGAFDVAFIADADSFVAPNQARSAVTLAGCTDQIVFAYDRFRYLDPDMSAKIMGGYQGDWTPGVEWSADGSCSSAVVVTRRLWDRVGGFDPGFVGWGFEDVAFSLACQAAGGGMHRIGGDVWHLWHEPAPGTGDSDSPVWQANKTRFDRYTAAFPNLTRILAIRTDQTATT